MVELKITLDNIDYSSIADEVMPLVREKLSESGNPVASFLGGNIPGAALGGAVNGFLKFMSPDQKDELAMKLINKNEKKIIEMLCKAAADKGVGIEIKSLSCAKAEN